MRIEKWLEHEIRFVEIDSEWWAVAKDVADALGYEHTPHMTRLVDADEKNTVRLVDSIQRGNPNVTVISEFGIYDAVWNSKRKEAQEFKKWVKQVLRKLRMQSGLEGFQVFRMLDKEFQKQMMDKVAQLKEVSRKDYIKANTIANKAISNVYGFPKMVKKPDMTPDMLRDRQPILEDTAELMLVRDKFDLDLSVKDAVYTKYNQRKN